ncbi:MAG: type II toxin-antitoxin system HicA family toxin [Treponema sp.]|nr:type II toxin-antitoxin system HicA family toxin [Treponema sp.]
MLYIKTMTAKEIMKILKANGWELERITSSHHIFSRPGRRPVSVPLHGKKDLGDFGKMILSQAGIKTK